MGINISLQKHYQGFKNIVYSFQSVSEICGDCVTAQFLKRLPLLAAEIHTLWPSPLSPAVSNANVLF